MPVVLRNNLGGAFIAAGAAASARARGYQQQTERLAREQEAEARRWERAISQSAQIISQMGRQVSQQIQRQGEIDIAQQQAEEERQRQRDAELWEEKWTPEDLQAIDSLNQTRSEVLTDDSMTDEQKEMLLANIDARINQYQPTRVPRGEKPVSIEESVGKRTIKEQLSDGSILIATLQPDGKLTYYQTRTNKAGGKGPNAEKLAKQAKENIYNRGEFMGPEGQELPIPPKKIGEEMERMIFEQSGAEAKMAQLSFLREHGYGAWAGPGAQGTTEPAEIEQGDPYGFAEMPATVDPNMISNENTAGQVVAQQSAAEQKVLPFYMVGGKTKPDPNALYGPRKGWLWRYDPETNQMIPVQPAFGE